MCKCLQTEKKVLDMSEFAALHTKIKNSVPRTWERSLSEAAFTVLRMLEERDAYDEPSQSMIDGLLTDINKKRKFLEAWKRRTKRKWNSAPDPTRGELPIRRTTTSLPKVRPQQKIQAPVRRTLSAIAGVYHNDDDYT